MANVNAFLQGIVKSAQSVCFEKFNLAETALGPNNADLQAVKPDMDRIFNALEKPNFWNTPKPIETEGTDIMAEVIALDKMQPPQFNAVAVKIRSILSLLDTGVLKEAAKPLVVSNVTSGMNIRILNALRMTRQQINIRLQKFADANNDLSQDPGFKVDRAKQDTLVNTYREKLKANLIDGQEGDVDIIQALGTKMSATTTTELFMIQFKKLSNFIQGEFAQA